MGTRWRGMLAPIDKPTGDGRRMAKGAFTHRPLPLPLKWQRIDEAGHDTSVVVGLMDKLNIDETAGEVWAEGELFDDQPDLPRLSQDVAEAKLLTTKKVIGPSVDAGAAEMVFVEEGSDVPLTDADWERLLVQEMETGEPAPIEMLFTDYEIAAATLVTTPAFVEARPFELLPTVDQTPAVQPASVTAAVTGATDLPIADPATAWDGPAAQSRVFDKFTDASGKVDTAGVAKAFLYRDDNADPATKTAYKLGFADVIDGTLTMIPRGVSSCAGGHGVDAADIPTGEKDSIKSKVCTLYGKIQGQFSDYPDCPFTAASARLAVLTAAAGTMLPAEVFDAPADAPPYQLLTVAEARDGETFRRVAGYVAAFGTCHVGFRDVCVTPPPATVDYALFHRYPVDTSDGLTAAGRITTGLGEVGSGCTHLTCRRNDDHACRQYDLAEAIAHHDRMRTVAHVRATEYAGVGIWVQGVLADDATDADIAAVLARQRVSADWRDYAGHLEMVELLALAREEPGFPVPQTVIRSGRQHSLIAAGAVPPPADLAAGWGTPRQVAAPPDPFIDETLATGEPAKPCEPIPCGEADANNIPDPVAADPALTAADPAAAPPPPPEDCQPGDPGCPDQQPAPTYTGAMVALRMTEDDAARLAVDGGELADQLHLTLVYLGDAADINASSRQAIIDNLTALAAEWSTSAGGELQLTGDGFSINAFNPASAEHDPCIVLGVSGEQVAAAHQQVTDTVKAVYGPPAQHLPFVPHVTLAYTDDLSLIAQLADRTGPISFDRLRVAFAGSNHDIPLGGQAGPDQQQATPDVGTGPADKTAGLLAEIEAAFAAPAAHDRALTAKALLAEVGQAADGL